MKIIITGYHGFVGQNLVPFLEKQGHTIYGLGRTGKYTWQALADDTLSEADAIIHLAGKAHDTKNRTEEKVYFDVNYGLTVKAFEYFIKHKNIKTFIFFSSVKAAADKVGGEFLSEDVTPTPKGPYGESKAKAEKYIQDNISRCSDRNVYILRPCMMHGPGNKGNLSLLYKVVHLGLPWPLGAFENKRSFCSIRNVCYVVGNLINGENANGDIIPSGIYNLADDEALSTNELIDVICKSIGKKTRIIRFGKHFMTALAQLGDKTHMPLNTERLGKLTENYVVSNSKIKKALGIKEMPVSVREGLTYTITNFNKK